MPFLNFGGNKNKYCNLSDMNFFIKNMKNIKYRYSDPDPLFLNVDLRIPIRIHYSERWIRGSGFTFSKCGSLDPDPDPCQNEMDPKRWLYGCST